VSDWEGGVCRIAADGQQRRILARNAPVELRPNGIALLQDGSFLLANLAAPGGVWQLGYDGDLRPFLTEVDNSPLPPTNFVLADAYGRIWITISTQVSPRAKAYRPDVSDGYIIVVDSKGARVAATDLGYTNEVQLHPSGDWLYVNETFARRTSRMRIQSDGTLGKRQTVTEYSHGTYPDGLYFDEAGGFWVVSIVSNRVIRVGPDGSQTVIIEDSDKKHLEWVESAFLNGCMGREHLDNISSKRLRSTSSIAFGGPERRLSYLGCLLGTQVASFEVPVAGVKPVHWQWHMGQSH
jgi:sugar lactone lactonase YvrE